MSTSNGSSSSGGSTSSTGTCSSASVDPNQVGIYHMPLNNTSLNPNFISHLSNGFMTSQQLEQQVDALTQMHHLEVSRLLQERSCRAISPMSLPSVRGTPTTSFELYQAQMHPSRSEQPTPVIRHHPDQGLYHNRTHSYTQATSPQHLPQPFQSPIQQIYNPIQSDGPVKRRYLQVHHPPPPQQTPIFQHQKSGSCSSAISSHGSSSLVAPGCHPLDGCQRSPELACNPAAFEMKAHGRQQSSAGRDKSLSLNFYNKLVMVVVA